MEEREEHALSLLDSSWFHHHILRRPLPPPPPPPPQQLRHLVIQDPRRPRPVPPSQPVHARRHPHKRYMSEELDHSVSGASPRTRSPPKLETILSGQVHAMTDEPAKAAMATQKSGTSARTKKKLGRRISKSLSDLEFQELKGFLDLGFTFDGEAEADPRLLEVVPGLKRAGRKSREPTACVPRPYLSEAWKEEEEDEEEERLQRRWRIPAAGEGEEDLKVRLSVWAKAVASAVR